MFAPYRTTMPLGQARRQRRSPTLLVLALVALGSLLILWTGCSSPAPSSSARPARVTQAQSVRQVPMHLVPAPPISTTVRTAQRHLYLFAPSNVGLMQPAVDAQGHVWVGEMHVNRLGRLTAQTGVVTSWAPPDGRYGIMATTVDAQGDAWFAEVYANYIGRFDRRQQTFRTFPLGTWQGSPLGPQDVHFDSKGLLWFTAVEAGALGRLDPRTGAIRLWPVPSSPSTLTLTPTGRVWFGLGGALGNLDPQTGQISLYRLPNSQAQVFSMATDSAGRLWFTEVLPGKLGLLDPTTGTLTELPVPALSGRSPALFALVIDHQDAIWFVDGGAGTLVRYAPRKHTLTFFQLSLSGSAPFGLTLDPVGRLWFTAGGSSANYIGEMAP
jgi:virginiamycin B lyase